MHWIKRNPIFFTLLILLGLVLAVELVLLVRERSNLDEVRQSYESKVAEYDRLLNHSPSLTRQNLELVREDQSNVEQNLAAVRAALGAEADVGDLFENVPVDSTEAFFDLQAFVDRYRERARQAGGENGEGIRLRDDESFGFSRYRSQGPPAELIEAVYKQRQIAGYLLDTLFQSGPVELVRIRRDDVAARRDIGTPGGDRDDVFTIPEAMSARIPDFVETYPFQLTFTGYTWTLRDFLNRLSSFEMPVIVRGVEVLPANGDGAGAGARRDRGQQATPPTTGAGAGQENGAVPIVEPHLSRFVVTVEYIELVTQDNDSGEDEW